MRSRYSAFALGEVAYLLRTLHPVHPDRARPAPEVLRELKATCTIFKYPELEVLDHRPAGPAGPAQVLFLARVFENGRERSFVERSDFEHDGAGWRYVGGVLKGLRELGGTASRLRLATFPG
jgi:SEC-C motif-containing protein